MPFPSVAPCSLKIAFTLAAMHMLDKGFMPDPIIAEYAAAKASLHALLCAPELNVVGIGGGVTYPVDGRSNESHPPNGSE